MSETSTRKTLGTVRNAALLLDLLSEAPGPHQLTDLAERSAMSVPTVHRLLRSLVEAGLAAQDPRSARYGLGPELVRLGTRYLAGIPALRAAAPYLLDLRDVTTATILLAIRVEDSVVYVDRIDGPESRGIYRDNPRVHPLLETAAGRVLAAHADEALWPELLAEKADRSSEDDLRRWRKESFVVWGGDHLEGAEVAVPVFDGDGSAQLALCAAASPDSVSEREWAEKVVPHLLRSARAIARALGHG